jgi:DNA invertase Pin-like site-specific DNA recombinase
MSTDVQLKGDSLRRQTELTRQYVEENGLELAEDDVLEDIGVSAFTGANLSGGALGRFLTAVRSGKVEKGSYLIVESLDRISRQEVMTSLAVFTDIINSGINIVTLADRHVYVAGKTDFQQLIYSVVVMSRAHEESQMKSHRLSAAWQNKRNRIDDRKLTSRSPAWLRLSDDKRTFEIDEEKAKLVRAIFEESAAGIGNYTIARRLNEAAIPPFVRGRGWQTSSINKILSSRAVIGEFQPHKFVGGQRLVEGNPILGYFPPVIEEALFYRVQAARSDRRVGGRGRKGKTLSNLFSGIATCGYCGARMHFVNKGPGPKGGTYLVCDAARRGLGCERTGWRYQHFETSFLAFVEELDLEQLVRGQDDAQQRAALDANIEECAGKMRTLERQRERTYALFVGENGPSAFLAGKLKECEASLDHARNEWERLSREREQARFEASRFYESKDQIRDLISRFRSSDTEEVYQLRAQIASRLRSLVSSLIVCPLGTAPLTRQTVKFVIEQGGDADVEAFFDAELADRRAHRRYFAIVFKDKTHRVVFPNADDPLQFEEQLRRGESGRERVLHSGHTHQLS